MTAEIIKKNEEEFYTDGANYWSEIPATIDGMLGGFGYISEADIKGSKMLLKQLLSSKFPPGREYALDCGAGIGRITKYLLTEIFTKVDMVEQNPTFLEKAKVYLGQKINKVVNFFAKGLQNFEPLPQHYDVIWIQWVIGHLTDDDLVQFLQRCQNGLKTNGVIILKENVTSGDELELDKQDSSVTRSMNLFRKLFEEANLDCYRVVKQQHFPKGLFSVFMFVLKPRTNNFTNDKLVLKNQDDSDTRYTEINQLEDNSNECIEHCNS